MADNLSQKSHKTSEKNKYNNSIHRTTSESLRLNDTEKGNSHPTSLQSASHNSRKISSFQITSVTVGSRVSTDAGEDSADDLDESHTDDISRITDLENETPSFSEDTFSKDDVFYNASSASLGCAPVIPTSSQYGLAIVGQDVNNMHPGGVAALNNTDVGEMHVSVTNSGTGSIYNIIGNSKPPEGMKEIQEQVRNERFKVVKIESTEPFRRGRWMCMDYLDHTTTQPSAPLIVNNVDSQTETSTLINVPDSGVVLNDSQHEDSGTVDSMKAPSKDLQLPNSHPQHDPHNFPVASPGQSLTQPLNMMQAPSQSVPLPAPQSAPVTVQSPPIELPQQLSQNQGIQSNQQPQAQSMSHIPHPAPSAHPPPTQQPTQPVQQMTQSFPAHQLQQVIAQSQGMPQIQPMQMHQQLPTQQMQQIQNQQAQIQMQGQHLAHNTQQISNIQQIQQMPQLQPMQNQGQMQQLSGQQPPMQQIQMQQMGNQQVSGQAMHPVHTQQPTMQAIPQQVHQIQNQQSIPNQQPQMQHIPNQSQMHPMQTQQTHQIPNHMQQMQQIPQLGNQNQAMSQMPMHQMTSQQNQVNSQSGQVQQQHNIHPQHGIQHSGVQYPQGNPAGMMQQQMPAQPQHMTQQVSSQVQPQHSVPQYYQQQPQLSQGQSLPQDVMANMVNSQQGATLPNNIQSITSQPQGATLPSNLQGMNTQQNSGMHSINQQSQNMSQNMQMMTQQNQNIPMAMDSNQGNMQMPVSDPIYMQTSNVNQQMPMNQHIGAQQNIINQQVATSNTQGQLPMGHVIPSQQGMSVGGQAGVMNQNNMSGMQQGQSMNQQMPQVSMSNVPQQQPTQPIMQNMVPPTQQNIPMSMQQNHPGSIQGPAVHSVPTSVVQSQSTMHPQVGMPMGGFNNQSNVGSIPQNVTPSMSQTTMTAPVGMQNAVNPMDIHITQQNICSTASATQPIISNTNSPVVSLLVNSSMSYPPGTGTSGGDSFGSPVSGVVSHAVNSIVNTISAVAGGEGGGSESGGGTPASDGAQQQPDGTGGDNKEETPNNEDSESFNGLAMALGGRSGSNPPSRASTPQPHTAAAHTDLHTHNRRVEAVLRAGQGRDRIAPPAMSAAADVRVARGSPPQPAPALPRIRTDIGLNDTTLFAVYCFIKNFIGASGTSAVAIDNKIEQAMDLVKSHLMFAVREEVEVLKEKIAELMERINQLELENSILRQHATQETLAQLSPAPPSPPSGPVS